MAFIRGRRFGYGEGFDCRSKQKRNWVEVYNPVSKALSTLYDGTIPFDGGKWQFCVFEQMQLSHDSSLLYLVSPVYATSGSLAIINLSDNSIKYVPGVNSVYVIESGPHRDELIYQRRISRKSLDDGVYYPAYPFVHARPDGRQIAEISDEHLTVGGNDKLPILRKYLRSLGGTITVDGQRLP